jgi:hypothetical protein
MDGMAWLLGLIVLMLAYWLTSTILKLSRQRRLFTDLLSLFAIILLGLLSFGILSIVGVNNINPWRFILVFVGIIGLLRVGRIFSGFGASR